MFHHEEAVGLAEPDMNLTGADRASALKAAIIRTSAERTGSHAGAVHVDLTCSKSHHALEHILAACDYKQPCSNYRTVAARLCMPPLCLLNWRTSLREHGDWIIEDKYFC